MYVITVKMVEKETK